MYIKYHYKNIRNYRTPIKRKGIAFVFYPYASYLSTSYYLVNGTPLKGKSVASTFYPSTFYHLVNGPCILRKGIDNKSHP